MEQKTIGVAVTGRSPGEAVASIQRLEEMGVPAAWLTSGGATGDALTSFAAAAARNEHPIPFEWTKSVVHPGGLKHHYADLRQ